MGKLWKCHRYTPEQEDWLRIEGPHWSRRELGRNFNAWFGTDLTAGAVGRKCRVMNIPLLNSGPAYTGPFQPGHLRLPGAVNMTANAGSFGAPGRPGGSPQRPIGAERFESRTGLLVKVLEPDPYRPGTPYRWVRKARWVWEQAHGPIPEGMVVICEDGDPMNCRPSNLVLASRGVVAAVNSRMRSHTVRHPGVVRAEYARARLEEAIERRGGGR